MIRDMEFAMLTVSYWTYPSFFIYLLSMLLIGLYFYKRSVDVKSFVIGNRKLGPWVTALSAFASDMSGWLLMGLPGLAYSAGLMEAFWCMAGLLIGSFLNWILIAKRLRERSLQLGDAMTISSYLERRFEDDSQIIKRITAVMIIFFFTIYTSAQFVAGAKLFEVVLGMNYFSGLFITALSLSIYIFLGGYLAVCWTDFFQGILMLGALIIVPLVALYGAGGVGGIGASVFTIQAANINFLSIFTDGKGSPISLVGTLSLLAWGAGYMGQPHILVRFMSISDPKELKKATAIATSWTFLSMSMAIIIGIIGFAFVIQNPAHKMIEAEKIFMLLINLTMNPLIGGLMLAAILAAAQSTASSQLLVASSALVEDLLAAPFLKKTKRGDRFLLYMNKMALLLIIFIAIFIAKDPNSSVLSIVSYAWAGLGATLGPVIILSLYWKKMTRPGAIAGMLVGGISVVVWKNFIAKLGGGFAVYELLPSFILSFLAIIIISKLQKTRVG